MEQVIDKARTLTEALPYIRRFGGTFIVVQPSAEVVQTSARRESLATDISLLKHVGIHPVVVLEGRESGEVVSALVNAGGRAVGVSGRDACSFTVRRENNAGRKGNLDGEVEAVDVSLIKGLCEQGYIPVVASIGLTRAGEALEVDPENAAGEIAESLRATKLIYLIEERGVQSGGTLLSFLDLPEAEALVRGQTLDEEMVERLSDAVNAIKGGVTHVHILDGRLEHAVVLELFTDSGVGTMISNERTRL